VPGLATEVETIDLLAQKLRVMSRELRCLDLQKPPVDFDRQKPPVDLASDLMAQSTALPFASLDLLGVLCPNHLDLGIAYREIPRSRSV
jgi:hypothetical protein